MKIQRCSRSVVIVEGGKRVDRCRWGCDGSPKKSGRGSGPVGWSWVARGVGKEARRSGVGATGRSAGGSWRFSKRKRPEVEDKQQPFDEDPTTQKNQLCIKFLSLTYSVTLNIETFRIFLTIFI